MSTPYQTVAMARELTDKLKKLVPSTMSVVTESNDSDQNPVITLSADATPATGEKVIVIRFKQVSQPTAVDMFSRTDLTGPYGPVMVQICTEKNYEGATDNVLDILGPGDLLPLLMEIGKLARWTEWYRTANGTVPSTAAMIAANLAATWKDLYWNVQA